MQKICIGYGLDARTGKMELDILGAPGVVVHDIETNLMDRNCTMLISRLHINFSGMRLLKGELIPVSIVIQDPVLTLDEKFVRSLLSKNDRESLNRPIFCRSGINIFFIENGKLEIAGPSGISVHDLSASLEHIEDTSSRFKISGSGKIEYRDSVSEFETDSTVEFNLENIFDSVFNASVKTNDTPLDWIPLSSENMHIKDGLTSTDLNIAGGIRDGISFKGSAKFKSAVFDLTHREQSKRYDIPSLDCILDASIKDRVVRIDSLNMKNSDLEIDVDMMLDLNDMENPDFRLAAESNFMTIETFRSQFPYHITKPWLKDTLFPMFEKGMVRMDSLVLDGTFDQFEKIKDDANHSILSMAFSCESFVVSNMGIQIPVTGVSALVEIRDGNLRVSGLKGVFGDSKINEGSIDVEGMIGGSPFFRILADGDFDIRELLSHRELHVIPNDARDRIEQFKELDGRLIARTVIGYHGDWKTPKILSGDFSFRDTIYHKRVLDLPLKFSRIDFNFSEEEKDSFSGRGTLGNSLFSVSGNLEMSDDDLIYTYADIRGRADMNELLEESFIQQRQIVKFREILPVGIIIKKQDDGYRYTGNIDAEKLVIESEKIVFKPAAPGNIVTFDIIHSDDGRLDMEGARFKLGTSNIFASGEYDLTRRKLNALEIISQDLLIEDLGIDLKKSENKLSGRLKGRLDFAFLGKGIKGMQLNGSLSGENISFNAGILPLPISEGSFRVDLSGKSGFIDRGDLKFGSNPLRLKGIIRGWDKLKGDFLLTSEFLDLTEIILSDKKEPYLKRFPKRESLFEGPDINLRLSASSGIWRKLEFKRLNAEMNFSGSKITIKNAQAELEKGDASVRGNVERRSPGKIDIEARINLENQSVEKLLSDTGFGDRGIKGTVSLESLLSIKGETGDGILKNLSGNIGNMIFTKGLLKNSRVFLRILAALNIPDKFRERPDDMKEDGFYFERLEGTALIEKGILKTEEFVLKSPAFNAVGSGEENLYDQTHDIRLLVQPLGNIDFIISHIPIVGRILVEGDETFFTVGYDVTGPWNDPDLDIVPMENLKGLFGVFKRALLTPYKIIENIGNAAKSMQRPDSDEVENEEFQKGEVQ